MRKLYRKEELKIKMTARVAVIFLGLCRKMLQKEDAFWLQVLYKMCKIKLEIR